MKRNKNLAFALFAFAALTFTSGAALAGPHHWNNNAGNGGGYSQLTDAQQATAQKLHNDFYNQTSALRQQLTSKRYEYNALLTAEKPDSAKIEAVAQEMEGLSQKLDQQRVKFDVAMAQAGIPRHGGAGDGCRGGGYSGGGHRGGMHRG
ncbi:MULTISPECIES: zinc resistance sensor/chaperone ZraP [Enterobacteriaceae]|uniref:Zinc resistance-associated protein n=1 Tax=Kluyvera genomosp. 2 TaxID=2774054 RepID=A0A2T2XVU9_9ENTR|nr:MULTISPECIES: zinc resistance sensor/chaperone ZraP [Enterobacteriaceae]HAT3920872.1 zinc resistance sensor/chaperone ZraP [Kluyvera ascorbata]PSR44433.1 zinc resistance-associated protein ZraP [Kluyvera genomosp. 2]BBQ85996.1 zinc resistance protein [Klebsiella sp. WP3-W18-ESBL-02]BBR22979.1 zinc resistance protein [Klebsiella sp. WP3-S18-ESBL-05]BBR61022.1 zinc resistance protein [Klebsiella sp. WP4-W18-ESBL-05]